MNYQNNNFFDFLALISSILQILNYIQNLKQTSNDTILKELQKQNKEYLEKILKNLEEEK